MVRRQQQLDSSVTGTRRRGRRGPEQQEFSRAGMIYGAEGDLLRRGSSRVSVFASPSAAPVFVHSPELANIKPLSHRLTAATPAQIYGENVHSLLLAFTANSSIEICFNMSHHLASGLVFVKFKLPMGGGVSVSDVWQMRNGSNMNLVAPSRE